MGQCDGGHGQLVKLLALLLLMPALALAQSGFEVPNLNATGPVKFSTAPVSGGMLYMNNSGMVSASNVWTTSKMDSLDVSQVSIYNSSTLLTAPKVVIRSGQTSGGGGLAVFQLTTDGTSSGTAIFNNIYGINVDINASDSAYGYSWATTNANRTLTVTVVKPGTLLGLGLIPYVAAANGVSISARVFGN